MSYTLSELLQDAYKDLGQLKAARATGDSHTTIVDSKLAEDGRDGDWNGGTVFIIQTDGAAPLINWLKAQLALGGKAPVWLSLAVSAVLAVAALFLSQELTLADFSPENLLAALDQVLAVATLAYKLLSGE